MIAECTEGARFPEPHVRVDEGTKGVGFGRSTGPPSIWSLPWDLPADAEFGGQTVEPKARTPVVPGGGGSREKFPSSQSIQQDLYP